MSTHELLKRTRVFICYNGVDKKWLKLLLTHLKPQIRDEGLDVFAGDEMDWGVRWREEIERALQSARIAILLISKDFLASDFIAQEELPPLLAAAKREEVRILSLIIGPSNWPPHLSQYQAVNPPSRTLSEMSEPECDRLIVKLVKFVRAQMKDVSGNGPKRSGSAGVAAANTAALPEAATPQATDPDKLRRTQELMSKVLVVDSDLDNFCIIYYGDIYKRFSAGMDRVQKYTMLWTTTTPEELLKRLRAYLPERFNRFAQLVEDPSST